uniref:Secreted protein n=1 Tax=Ascaris lumbricoides TaxID=6252 RepID=A0A0M3HF45_ASCLU
MVGWRQRAKRGFSVSECVYVCVLCVCVCVCVYVLARRDMATCWTTSPEGVGGRWLATAAGASLQSR